MIAKRFLRLSVYSVCFLVTVALYAYVVRLPLFLDDLPQTYMIRNHPGSTPGWNFWAGDPTYPFYRPLVFSVWEWNGIAMGGRFDPAFLHWISVLCFGSSAALLTRVTDHLTRNRLVAVFAGLSFAVFPFSYNTVNWIGAQFHLFAIAGILLAVWGGLCWQGKRHIWGLLLAWVGGFIALFSHENGVLTLPLMLVALWVAGKLQRRRDWISVLTLVVPLTVLTLIFLYLYMTVRIASPLAFDLNRGMIRAVGLFALAFAYPLAALPRWLWQAEASNRLLWGIGLIAVLPALLYLFGRRVQHRWIAAYGLFWFGLAALPSILLLPISYIQGSWRLMSLSSVGAALFWAVIANALWASRRVVVRAVLLAVLIFSATVALTFLGQRRHEALLQSDYSWALQALMLEHTQGQTPYVVNPPAFLASTDARRHFPAVGMGVQFMADYVSYFQMFWAHTGEPFPYVHAILFPPALNLPQTVQYAPYYTLPPERDFTTEIRNASDIFVTVFEGEHFYPIYVGGAGMPGSNT
ncbi:MAG: hypothetical protein ACOYL5_19510, partial [Phototrophicaceae bacterium]